MTLDEIYNNAQNSPYGIIVSFSTQLNAKRTRRKLYAFFSKTPSPERFSILMRKSDLYIVKRSAIKTNIDVGSVTVSNLNEKDLPRIIRARGPSKFSFHRIT